MSRKKLKAKAAPKLTREMVELKIARIAELQSETATFKALFDKSLAEIGAIHAQSVAPIEAEQAELLDEIFRWAEANRAEICAEGTKTASFATGEITWRLDPPSVSVPKNAEKVKALIDRLEDDKRLSVFVRQTPSLNKERILEEHGKSGPLMADLATRFPEIKIKQNETINLCPNQLAIDPIELSRKAS